MVSVYLGISWWMEEPLERKVVSSLTRKTDTKVQWKDIIGAASTWQPGGHGNGKPAEPRRLIATTMFPGYATAQMEVRTCPTLPSQQKVFQSRV